MSWQLTGVYVLLGVLLLSLNMGGRWSWRIKAGAILLTSAAYYLTYHSVDELKGWPVPDPLPERFAVHWVQVDEPNKATGEEGRIYIWLRHLDDLEQPVGKPRVHEILFDDVLAQRTQEVLASLMDGQQINGFVRMRETADDQEAIPGGQDEGNLGNQESGLIIEFKEVGKVDLPPKPTEIS